MAIFDWPLLSQLTRGPLPQHGVRYTLLRDGMETRAAVVAAVLLIAGGFLYGQGVSSNAPLTPAVALAAPHVRLMCQVLPAYPKKQIDVSIDFHLY